MTLLPFSPSARAAILLSLMLVSTGRAQVTEQDARALLTMQSVTVIGGFVRDWCFARAPQTKAAVNTGFNGWRQDNRLDVFEKTLTGMSSEALKSLQDSLESGRTKMYAELDKAATNPAQECLGIRSYLNAQLNPQKMYPSEYAAALKVQATPAPSNAGKPAATSSSPTPSKPQTPATSDRRFKWVTAPGKGVQPSQIETVLHSGEGVMTVTGYQFEETWLLLLKDGWGYRNPSVSPADLDVKASRQNEPQRWFKWKSQGGKYLRLNDKTGQWQTLKGSPVVAATRGERFSRSYKASSSVSYGGGAYGSYSSFSTLEFNQDGTFDSSNYSIGGTGTMQSMNGFSSTTASTASKDGCTATNSVSISNPTDTNAAPVGGGGTSRKSDCGAGHTGTYTLDGYTLELRFSNGQVQRQMFFYWDGKKTHAFIGNSTYTLPKK